MDTTLRSNNLCARRRVVHDGHHDFPHPEQVHGSWYVLLAQDIRPCLTLSYATSGRKEILMFFYLYAIIELLAFFLDSGIIPTANVSYPVSRRLLTHGRYSSEHCPPAYSGSPRYTLGSLQLPTPVS